MKRDAEETLISLLCLMTVASGIAGDTCPDVNIVGLGGNEKLAILRGCPGAPGATGPKGNPGFPGARGASGLQGIPGKIGPAGEKGERGFPGSDGAKGDKGDTGPRGQAGASGPPGPAGATGARGAVGAPGAMGERGFPGSNGAKGAKGDIGAVGAPGQMGASGAPGRDGAKGDKGAAGTLGRIGERELGALHCQQGAKNCRELLARGAMLSGWYTVYPKDCVPLVVLCDMDTDGGGWTVFQKRSDGSVDFYRDWNTYKRGFGSRLTEFWLGNDNIHLLTSLGENELRVDLTDFDNSHTFAKYQSFKILGESDKYKLVLGSFLEGTAGDSLSYHNNLAFTTKDQDNDMNTGNCAVTFKGAWWYKDCHYSNLNGIYWLGAHSSHADGVNWKTGKGYNYSYKHSEMKFRPRA